VQKVEEGLKGLKNAIADMQKKLGDPNLTRQQRAELQRKLSEASKKADQVEKQLESAKKAAEEAKKRTISPRGDDK